MASLGRCSWRWRGNVAAVLSTVYFKVCSAAGFGAIGFTREGGECCLITPDCYAATESPKLLVACLGRKQT